MNTRQKNVIALFIDASTVGGIERYVSHLAAAMRTADDFDIHVILWKDYGNSVLQHCFLNAKVPLHDANGSLFKLLCILQKQKFTILHSHGYKANLISRLVRVVAGVKVITSHHNGDLGTGKVRLYTELDRRTAFFSTNWVVSQDIKNRLQAPSLVMPNFVPLNVSQQPPKGNKIVFAGRLVDIKRIDRVLSIARLCPEQPFLVFGEGPLYQTIAAQLPKNVRLMGFESNPDVIWREAALCLICSDQEGLPMVALEAMSRGIPVSSTPVGQLPDLIQHGKNGFLAQTDQAFANIILSWFSASEEHYQSVTKAALTTIQDKYSIAACLPEYIAQYRQCSSSFSFS